MKTHIHVTTVFHCSLERAFKTPMLCDIRKVHTGFGLLPKVTHTSHDEDWGKIGSSKTIFMARSFLLHGEFASIDNILDRKENAYWKIEVNGFQTWMFGFYKFVGEWKTHEIAQNIIQIDYTYTLYSKSAVLYPINWLFTKTIWKIYMKHVMENVRKLAMNEEPYLYD